MATSAPRAIVSLLGVCGLLCCIGTPGATAVRWVQKPFDQSVVIGNRVKFVCVLADLDGATVIWLKGTNTIFLNGAVNKGVDPRYHIEEENNLVIDNVNMSDDSLYTCSVFGFDAVQVKLTVLLPPGPPQISLNSSSAQLVENSVISFTCSSTGGKPDPEIHWLRNGVLDNSAIVTHPDVAMGTSSSQIIVDIQRTDHLANYTCRVTNDANVNSPLFESRTLHVQYSPSLHFEPAYSPHRVKKRTPVTIKCVIDANPQVSSSNIQWKKNGQPILMDTPDTLEFLSIQKSDSGNYTCTATNYIQNTSKSSTISVVIDVISTDISVDQFISVGCKGNAWNVSVDIEKLRQIYPDTTPSYIYMGENTCIGVYNGVTLTFNQGLRECLTSEQISGDTLMYNNELVYAEHDPLFSYIIRHYNWTVSVECDVTRNNTSTGHIYHDTHDHSHHPVTGSNHYAVNMSFYQDPNFIHHIPGNPLHVQVGTDVYTMVYTPGTDWTVKMRVHTCYTKPTPSSPDHMKYYLMRNGCEVDGNTHIISQSSHETRFVFQDFEYTTNPAGIYVYCDSTFCASTDYSRQCTQTCNPITKRSVNSHSDGETEKTWKQITRGDDRISEADDAESELRDTLTDIGKSGVEFLTRQRRTVYRQIIHTK